jgi:hypothetical protein
MTGDVILSMTYFPSLGGFFKRHAESNRSPFPLFHSATFRANDSSPLTPLRAGRILFGDLNPATNRLDCRAHMVDLPDGLSHGGSVRPTLRLRNSWNVGLAIRLIDGD